MNFEDLEDTIVYRRSIQDQYQREFAGKEMLSIRAAEEAKYILLRLHWNNWRLISAFLGLNVGEARVIWGKDLMTERLQDALGLPKLL